MNDEEWERLRRRERIDRWATRVSWVLFAIVSVIAAVFALMTEWSRAAGFVLLAIAAFVTAHWHPALVKFDDVEKP